MKAYILLLLILLTPQILCEEAISCKNSKGDHVDWWVILKMPREFNNGQKYYYYDSDESSKNMSFHEDINDNSDSPLFQTLKQSEDATNSEQFLVYWNDQFYDDDHVKHDRPSSYAHAKGVLAGNGDGGYLINHSTPGFIKFNDHTKKIDMFVEEGQRKYAQHYFCISMNHINIEAYSTALLIDRVYVDEHSYIPDALKPTYPNLQHLTVNKNRNTQPFEIVDIKSTGGQQFHKFAKSYRWRNDLYSTIVAPYYKQDFIFETWGRSLQPGDFSSQYTVVSNLFVNFSDSVNYKYTYDHSKYGCSSDQNSNVVCFGDLNRMTSQFKRGGGTICFENQNLHTYIRNIFQSQQEQEQPQQIEI